MPTCYSVILAASVKAAAQNLYVTMVAENVAASFVSVGRPTLGDEGWCSRLGECVQRGEWTKIRRGLSKQSQSCI
jgi:hypothetical protein